MKQIPLLMVAVGCLLNPHASTGANWPAWRGANGDGITTETELPLNWSRTEKVVWRTDLSEPGNSTPIVWGDRLFVTQTDSEKNRRNLLCFDAGSGRLLWKSGVEVSVE